MLIDIFEFFEKKRKKPQKDRIPSYGLLTEGTGDRIQNSNIEHSLATYYIRYTIYDL